MMILMILKLKMGEVQITGEWGDPRINRSKSSYLKSGYQKTLRSHSLKRLRKETSLKRQDLHQNKFRIGLKTLER